MTGEEKLKQAMNIVTRGNDIESAKTILEAVTLDNYKLVGGRVNHFKIAVRQILNYIEETQNKGILDITREKVALKEELKKQDNRIKELEADNYECNNIIRDYIEELEFKDKLIDAMLEVIEECRANDCLYSDEIDLSQIAGTEQIKQYFENLAKESGEIDEY